MPEQKATPSNNLEAELFSDLEADLFDEPPKEAKPAKKGSWTGALPTVGGMLGSLVGGSKISPVGMALAGVGGAAGEAYRQVADAVRGDFSHIPESMTGRLQQIAKEGLTQAGLEGGGRVVGAAIRPIAKTVYGVAMRPAKALMRDAGGGKLIEGARRIINQGYDDAILPNSLGAQRAGRLLKESAEEATQLAAKNANTVKTARVIQRAIDDQGKRAGEQMLNAGVTPKTDQIATQIGNLLDSNPQDIAMSDLLKLRRGAEEVARPAFKAAKMPGGAPVALGSEASVAKSIAGAAKTTLDDVLGEPFKQINARSAARGALRQAADDAAARPNMLTNLIAGGAGVGSMASGDNPMDALEKAAMLRLLFSPTAQAGAALAAGRLPYAQIFRAGKLAMDQE